MSVIDKIPRIVAIVGPTAAGKSSLAMEVGPKLDLPILCCDSVQVYRGLDIGSAKPTTECQSRWPHRLIDLVDPDEEFCSGSYSRAAMAQLDSQTSALLCGGTGLYLRSLCWTNSGEGAIEEVDRNDPRRREFEAKWLTQEEQVPHSMWRRLREVDADLADQIHPNNRIRVLRALWMCEQLGGTVSAQRARHPPSERTKLFMVVLDPGQEQISVLITQRLKQMIRAGWIDEVEKLKNAGYDARYKSMRSLGYKQMIEYLEGQTSYEDTLMSIERETRRYAKRQRSYFYNQIPVGQGKMRVIRHPDEFPYDEVRAFVGGKSS